MNISHVAIKTQTLTCEACPEQYEGTLVDGRFFYFRYRHGVASLAVGDTPESVNGYMTYRIPVGEGLQGMFDNDDQRNETFAALMAEVDR